MPPRKEPKETVTYPASKRKAPPFKPQRPAKVARTEGESFTSSSAPRTSSTTGATTRTAAAAYTACAAPRRWTGNGSASSPRKSAATTTGFAGARVGSATTVVEGRFSRGNTNGNRRSRVESSDSEPEDGQDEDEARDEILSVHTAGSKDDGSSSDSGLADDPLQATATGPRPTRRPPARRARSSRISPSPHSRAQSPASRLQSPARPQSPTLSDRIVSPLPLNEEPTIPRALLIRLVHSHFSTPLPQSRQQQQQRRQQLGTRIDSHAAAVLAKYVEVFVREAVARAALRKRREVEAGLASQSDVAWLERGDLEAVVAGLVLDL